MASHYNSNAGVYVAQYCSAQHCLLPNAADSTPPRFFEDYKKNEHKEVKVDDIMGAAEAIKCVKDGLNMYQEHYVPKK